MNSSANNPAHSVRTRLARISAERGVDFQQVLTAYAIERLLYRLSISRHAQQFILKGATLFTLWEGFPLRQTRDLDLLGFGDDTVERVEGLFRGQPLERKPVAGLLPEDAGNEGTTPADRRRISAGRVFASGARSSQD